MSKPQSCVLGVESLEGRWMPAVTSWVDKGVLYAQGDKGNNAAGVRVYADTITVLDGKTTVGTRPVAGITKVVLGGGFGGNDTFLLVLTEVAPRSLKVEGLEDVQFGRLAAAQTELRDLRKHPEMATCSRCFSSRPGRRSSPAAPAGGT